MFGNSTARRLLLGVLIGLGFLASLYYFSWFFSEGRYENPLLLLLFFLSLWYVAAQIYSIWFIYLKARPDERLRSPAPPGLLVDVFVPTYDEPLPLIERAVIAAVGMEYPHQTFVLDDGNSPRVRQLAESHGATYLARNQNKDYKAGNINFALDHSRGDFIVVFDVDHVPDPHFIARVLPLFSDPTMGVVQVALDHSNAMVSFVAEASAEMNDEFFAATMHGMDRSGAASVFGSNSVFRREALRDIGGYQPGLAEDLHTSLHIHAAGWKSAYMPEILARGLVPEDLASFVAQQYKWAKGVFDVLLQKFPGLLGRLSWEQRICYINRMTYYLAGPIVALHLLFLLAVPLVDRGTEHLLEYLHHLNPFVILFMLTHIVASGTYSIKPAMRMVRWRGVLLAIGSWPIYTAGFLAALMHAKSSYIPTPKESRTGRQLKYVLPQIAVFVLLIASIIWGMERSQGRELALALALVGTYVALHIGVIFAVVGQATRAQE